MLLQAYTSLLTLNVQGVAETSSHLPRLPEIGDNSVHNPNAQNRAGNLYAQLAQQQLSVAPQQELGGVVRGATAAVMAMQYAQVIAYVAVVWAVETAQEAWTCHLSAIMPRCL